MNNQYVVSIGAGIVFAIIQIMMKRTKNEPIEKVEIMKMAVAVAAIVLGALQVYKTPVEPVLSEPFISSSEF